jgi:Ca2+/Na+ antiporter
MNAQTERRFSPHESISKIGVTLIAAAFLMLTFLSDRLLPFGQWVAMAFMLCFLAIVALFPLAKRSNRRFLLGACLLAVVQGVASLSYLCNAGDLHPAVIALGALAVALMSYLLFSGLFARFATLRLKQPRTDGLRVLVYVMILTLFALCLAWSDVFPADLGAPDTINQLMQAEGTIPYSNVHTIAHTLLLAAVRAVDPSLGCSWRCIISRSPIYTGSSGSSHTSAACRFPSSS